MLCLEGERACLLDTGVIVIESNRIYKLQQTSKPRRRLAALVLCAICLAGTNFAAAVEPTPFRAEYQAKYKGFPISATGIRELTRTEDGRYLMTSSAKSFLASIHEQTLFTLGDKDEIVPVEYQYHRTGIGRNRSAVLTFDWDSMEVLNNVQSKPWHMAITDGTQDKLSYQQRMRAELASAWQTESPWPELHYQVADGGHLKEYSFQILGEEMIETPIGRVRTIKASRVRNDDDRSTIFWLAPEYDFLLVRFEQTEKDGDGFKLMLKEAEFDGEPVAF